MSEHNSAVPGGWSDWHFTLTPEAEEVRAIGELQKDLAELGAKVVELLQQAGGGPKPKPAEVPQGGGGGAP